jgi:hypothetical protein
VRRSTAVAAWTATRGAQISTPWNEKAVDQTGTRVRRASHDDPRFLEDVHQALT